MKVLLLGLAICLSLLGLTLNVQAQYKGPRDYFPKNYQPPPPRNNSTPATPAKPAPSQPAKRALIFKDLKVDTQFYLLSDTNHAVAWKKVSETSAKNVKSGKVSEFKATMAVRK